jgi:hypothetical protein
VAVAGSKGKIFAEPEFIGAIESRAAAGSRRVACDPAAANTEGDGACTAGFLSVNGW